MGLLRGVLLVLCAVLACTLPAQEAPKAETVPAPSPVVASQLVPDLVSYWGTTQVEGDLEARALSLFGRTLVNGSTRGDAVALFGDLEINGRVGGRALALCGQVKLGDKALVEGDLFVVCGALERAPGAVVRGRVRDFFSSDHFPLLVQIKPWLDKCLRQGRVLGFGEGLGWAWCILGLHTVVYLVLSLVFRSSVLGCAKTFELHPAAAMVSALFALVLTPLLLVLLALTGVGLLVIPFLLVGLFAAVVFGRTALHACVGRLLLRRFGDKPLAHVAVSVLLGAVIVAGLSCVPVLGVCVHALLSVLGLGAVIYTLILGMRKECSARAPFAPFPAVPAAAIAAAPKAEVLHGSPSPSAVMGNVMLYPAGATCPVPSPAPEYTLPRAGLGRRAAALGIDVALCCLLAFVLGVLLRSVPALRPYADLGFKGFVALLALYSALLWKLRATTLGGKVLHLKIVNLDGRPLDWTTVVVRVLGAFASLAVGGLGLFWIAIDPSRQAWHDKFAGTIVVVTIGE